MTSVQLMTWLRLLTTQTHSFGISTRREGEVCSCCNCQSSAACVQLNRGGATVDATNVQWRRSPSINHSIADKVVRTRPHSDDRRPVALSGRQRLSVCCWTRTSVAALQPTTVAADGATLSRTTDSAVVASTGPYRPTFWHELICETAISRI